MTDMDGFFRKSCIR